MRRPFIRALGFASLASSIALASPAAGQTPTLQDAQRMIQQDPELVRQRILQSGLSADQIRARLLAAGLPSNALDAFLTGGAVGPSAFTASTLSALELIGAGINTADGLEAVATSTGFQPAPAASGSSDVFGVGVFRRASSRFQPLLDGPVPDDYRVGPGDAMVLVITGDIELARELTVSREGYIVIPDVGQLPVANLTMSDLRALLRSRLARSYSGIERGSTSFDITVTRLRTIQTYVVGEVLQPGAYQLSSVATVMNALYAADGPTNLGNLRRIELRRRSGETITLDLYPYLISGDVSVDVGLEQGDVVFVPLTDRRVHVRGAVARPRQYELAAGDDLIDVLSAAGGFSAAADRRRLTIHRVLRPSEREPGLGDRAAIDLSLAASDDVGSPAYLDGVAIPPVGLQDGDSIVVDRVVDLTDGQYVTIGGAVVAPRTAPWREGMTIRDLVLLARGPALGADLREAEVSRLPAERVSGELAERLRVPLDSSYLIQRDAEGAYAGPRGLAFAPPGTAPEFALEPYDRVSILRQPEFEMPGSASVSGEVSVPGTYTLLTRNDRVTDLLSRAGGVLPSGYLEGARLVRSVNGLGRIDVDLPDALADPSGPNNVELRPGDDLHIPQYSPTVVVRGAVNSPVTVLYREGADLDYYVANAGGYRSDADEDRVSVRFANGQAETRSGALFWSTEPRPLPGSTISVPAQDPADRLDVRGLVADIVAIVGSVTTVIVVLTR